MGIKSGKTAIDIAEKDMQVRKLRVAGYTIAEIANAMSLSYGGVHKCLMRSIANLQAEDTETVRNIELERLDKTTQRVWSLLAKAKSPNHVDKLVRSLLSVMDRRSKYLGLDAPTKTENRNLELTDEVLKQTVADLLKRDEAINVDDST